MSKIFAILIVLFSFSCNKENEKKSSYNLTEKNKFIVEFSEDQKLSFWIPNNYKKENKNWINSILGKIELNIEKNNSNLDDYSKEYSEKLKKQFMAIDENFKTLITLNKETLINQYQVSDNNVVNIIYLAIVDFQENKYVLKITTTKEQFEKNKINFDKIISSIKIEYPNFLTELKIEKDNSKLKINEFYLGMNIEDAFEIVKTKYNLKPLDNTNCPEKYSIVEKDNLLRIDSHISSKEENQCNVFQDIISPSYIEYNYIVEIIADKNTKKVTKISFFNIDNIFKKIFNTNDHQEIAKIIGKNNIELTKSKTDYVFIDKNEELLFLTSNKILLTNDIKTFKKEEEEKNKLRKEAENENEAESEANE